MTDSDRDLGTSHLAKCIRCGREVQSYMIVGLYCTTCRDELDAQPARTRAATEASEAKLADALQASAPGYDRAKHEAVAVTVVADFDLALRCARLDASRALGNVGELAELAVDRLVHGACILTVRKSLIKAMAEAQIALNAYEDARIDAKYPPGHEKEAGQ